MATVLNILVIEYVMKLKTIHLFFNAKIENTNLEY